MANIRITIDNLQLTQSEAQLLLQRRARHTDKAYLLVVDVGEADRRAERVAKGETEADATIIKDGMKKQVAAQLRELGGHLADVPSPADVRYKTIKTIWNHTGQRFRKDPADPAGMTKEETGFPAWLFTLVDADADGFLSAADLNTYTTSLLA